MKIGPNVRRLIASRVSSTVVGKGGGIGDCVSFLSNPTQIVERTKQATEWVQAAIFAVRQAASPNPYRDADDETIAAEILRQIDSRRQPAGKS